MLRYVALGIIQGVTEFLPISSSGHLVIFQKAFGFGEPKTLFDALLHFGTLLAVVLVYRKRLWKLIRGLFSREGENRRYLGLLIVGTTPIALLGYFARTLIEEAFSSTLVVGGGLILTALVLWFAGKLGEQRRNLEQMDWKNALTIGLAQMVALIPGVSRSGMTISAGLFKKFEGQFAAEYSFLLMIPAVLGATGLKLWDLLSGTITETVHVLPYTLGTIAAALTGALAIKTLLKILKSQRFSAFSYYCLIAGIVVILLSVF